MTLPSSPGIYPGVSRADYNRTPGVNWSLLKHIRRSPAHLLAAMDAPDRDTDPKRKGRATHALALEPGKFFSRWAVWDGERRAGKDWDAFEKKCAAEGQEILTAKQLAECRAIAKAATTSEATAKYLRGGASEVTLLWTYTARDEAGRPIYSIDCKGRPDLAIEGGALVDLKTTADASEEGFRRTCWNYDYAAQAAFYLDGYEAVTGRRAPYIIVAVESSEPYVSQPYALSQKWIDIGRNVYRTCLDRLHECRRTNHWPGYGEGLITLEPPRWALGDEADDLSELGLEGVEEAA